LLALFAEKQPIRDIFFVDNFFLSCRSAGLETIVKQSRSIVRVLAFHMVSGSLNYTDTLEDWLISWHDSFTVSHRFTPVDSNWCHCSFTYKMWVQKCLW